MAAALGALIRILTRNVVFAGALVLLSIYFALPVLVPSQTGAFRFGAEFIEENRLDPLSEAVDSGVYDTAPQNIKDANEKQLELLGAVQNGDVKVSIQAQAEVAAIDLELYEAGNLEAEYEMLHANCAFLEGLANLKEPELYETTADEPMLYRLSELLGSIPPLLLIVPPIIVAYAAYRAIECDKVGYQFPLARRKSIAVAAIASCTVSLLGLAIAVAPSALMSLIMNGIGDPLYPVVMIQAGEVVVLTVGLALIRTLTLWFATVLFVTAISMMVFAITSSSVVGCLLGLAMGLVPAVPQYFSETFVLHDILRYLPTTYLYVAPVGGWPNYLYLMDVLPASGASWELGMFVLLLSATVLFMTALVLSSLRCQRCV